MVLYATKSSCMHQNTSTSSRVSFLLKHPTLSLVMSQRPTQPTAQLAMDTIIKRTLRLPIYLALNQPSCTCGTTVGFFGDHIFKCTLIHKIGAHNLVCDGFSRALAPFLSTAGYVPPNSTVKIKPQLYLPSDPHSCPFDLSFNSYPASTPNTTHGCTFATVSADITMSSLPPKPTLVEC
jgi:hypothetical protein